MGINENHKIHEYMDNVCSQIRNSKVHKEVRDEVEGHIEEIIEEYLERGFSIDEAVNKAVAQMGDPSLIGKELNKVHKENPEWSVLALTLIFTSIGLFSIFLIKTSGVLRHDWTISFVKTIVSTLVGLAAVVGFYFFDYRKIQRYSKYVYFGSLAILLITIFMGVPVNGKYILSIGGTSINFFDICPFFFIIALSGILGSWRWNETTKALQGIALIIIPAALMMAANSFYAVAVYTGAVVSILIASGLEVKHTSLLVTSVTCLAVFYIMKEPYRIARFTSFLNPEKNPLGDGYQNIQLDKAIHSAGLWGNGITAKADILPNIHSEFIFTYIVYTFGWFAGILLAGLVLLFVIRISRIAFIVRDCYGKMLISGLVAIFSIQFLWNILMNLGLAPIIGIGLPFISYGNSQFIMNMTVIGLISNIYKQRNVPESIRG